MTGAEIEPVYDAEIVPTDDRLPGVPDYADINNTLTDEAAEDLANSGRENTRQTYEDQWKAFARWCAANAASPDRPPHPRTWRRTSRTFAARTPRPAPSAWRSPPCAT
ncbi:hypothetical protein D3C59_36875 [Streptomyces sp. SHP22-7]|nr:hypothetical protein D3C59_36875 [Streptomyces sp. SHP22-7]